MLASSGPPVGDTLAGTPLLLRMLEVYVPLVIACAAVDRRSCYSVAAAAVSSSAALFVSATVAAVLQLLVVLKVAMSLFNYCCCCSSSGDIRRTRP